MRQSQKDRQTDKQTGRQAGRQAGRQTDRQTPITFIRGLVVASVPSHPVPLSPTTPAASDLCPTTLYM